jgi:hypothetical protein
MRFTKSLSIVFICLFLSACVSSLLIGNQLQSKLMWSFLKPLVGFDPNEVNLFETPMIKNRMTALLGDKYEPTMKLLRTAQEIQQEGALFYVASRYAPPQAKAITDKAAMVWNADTNQMAVMLIKDGTPEIFSEQIEGAKAAITPALPKELQTALSKAQAAKQALKEQQKTLQNLNKIIENPVDAAANEVNQKLNSTKTKAGIEAKKIADQQTPQLPIIEEDIEQHLFDEALKKEAAEIEQKKSTSNINTH